MLKTIEVETIDFSWEEKKGYKKEYRGKLVMSKYSDLAYYFSQSGTLNVLLPKSLIDEFTQLRRDVKALKLLEHKRKAKEKIK